MKWQASLEDGNLTIKRIGKEKKRYRPNISRDEDDNGKGTKPCISNGEKHVARNFWTSEVPQREKHHSRC